MQISFLTAGLYLAEDDFLAELAQRYSRPKIDVLLKDEGFFRSVASSKFSRAITLTMLREITGDDMKEAFNVSLAERIRKFEHEFSGSDELDPDDALHQFQAQFVGRKLSKGVQILFMWNQTGLSLFRPLSEFF